MLDDKTLDLVNKYLKIKPTLQKKEDDFKDRSRLQQLLATSILNDIILSKNLFKRNAIIAEFLASYFDLLLSKSALNSRTTICGRITRHIMGIEDEDQLISLLNVLYKILIKISNGDDLLKKDTQDVIRGIKL